MLRYTASLFSNDIRVIYVQNTEQTLQLFKQTVVKSGAMKATAPSLYDYNNTRYVQRGEKEGETNDKDGLNEDKTNVDKKDIVKMRNNN